MKRLLVNFIYQVKYWFYKLILNELELKLNNNKINYCDYLEVKKYIKWKIDKL